MRKINFLLLTLLFFLLISCSKEKTEITTNNPELSISYIKSHLKVMPSKFISSESGIYCRFINPDSSFYYKYDSSNNEFIEMLSSDLHCFDYFINADEIRGLKRNGKCISEIVVQENDILVQRSWEFRKDRFFPKETSEIVKSTTPDRSLFATFSGDGEGLFLVKDGPDRLRVFSVSDNDIQLVLDEEKFIKDNPIRKKTGSNAILLCESKGNPKLRTKEKSIYKAHYMNTEGDSKSWNIVGIDLFVQDVMVDEKTGHLYLSEYHFNDNNHYESWIHCYDQDSNEVWSYMIPGDKEPKSIRSLAFLDNSTLFFAGSYQNVVTHDPQKSEFWNPYIYGKLNKQSGDVIELNQGHEEFYAIQDIHVLDENRILTIGYGNPDDKIVATTKTPKGRANIDRAEQYPAFAVIELKK